MSDTKNPTSKASRPARKKPTAKAYRPASTPALERNIKPAAYVDTASYERPILVKALRPKLTPLQPLRMAAAFAQLQQFVSSSTAEQLITLAKKGVPTYVLQHLALFLQVSESTLAKALKIPSSTLTRRKATGLFNESETESLLRLLRCTGAALTLFDGDAGEAGSWFSKPAAFLEGKTPLSICGSTFGSEQIHTLLVRLEYGVYS